MTQNKLKRIITYMCFQDFLFIHFRLIGFEWNSFAKWAPQERALFYLVNMKIKGILFNPFVYILWGFHMFTYENDF